MTRSGAIAMSKYFKKEFVLIPLLVDDPLWDYSTRWFTYVLSVLIPLLVDDPLWVIGKKRNNWN